MMNMNEMIAPEQKKPKGTFSELGRWAHPIDTLKSAGEQVVDSFKAPPVQQLKNTTKDLAGGAVSGLGDMIDVGSKLGRYTNPVSAVLDLTTDVYKKPKEIEAKMAGKIKDFGAGMAHDPNSASFAVGELISPVPTVAGVKAAVGTAKVAGKELSAQAKKILESIDLTPQVQKANGINAMFGGKGATGYGDAEKAGKAFSNIDDKQPRFEIDDSDMKLKTIGAEGNTKINLMQTNQAVKRKEHSLDTVIEHEDLFKQYPELRNVKVKAEDLESTIHGSYDPKSNLLSINSKLWNSDDIKSTILHELQHNIQTKEDFGRGGSADRMSLDDLVEYTQKNVSDKGIKTKARTLLEPKEDYLDLGMSEKAYDDYMKENKDDVLSYLINHETEFGTDMELRHKLYKSLLGEQEARDVQTRMNLSPEQRSSNPPFEMLKRSEGGLPKPIVKRSDEIAMDASSKSLNTDAVSPELIAKAAAGDPEAFKEVSGAVFSRTFERIMDKNTGDQLKPMVLDKLMQNPNIVEDLAAKHGFKIRYFSSNPENVGKRIGDTVIEERPQTRNKLKKQGYEAGNIWVYDPYDTHGAFNDPEYTKAWRGVHELAHALTERMMQAKYGDSRRFGALGNDTKNPYNPEDPRTYKGLTAEEAQRAIEWEDTAFRAQLDLMERMGIRVDKNQAVNDFNIAGSDTIIRTLTGDFSDPATLGVVPRADDYRIDVKNAL